jgi:hypothetical protein
VRDADLAGLARAAAKARLHELGGRRHLEPEIAHDDPPCVAIEAARAGGAETHAVSPIHGEGGALEPARARRAEIEPELGCAAELGVSELGGQLERRSSVVR